MQKYYISEASIIVDDRYANKIFVYNRQTRQKFDINIDAFVVLKKIYKYAGVSAGYLSRVLGSEKSDFIDNFMAAGVLSLEKSKVKYNIKEPKSSFIRLFIECTNYCNLRCRHCYGSFGMDEGKEHLRIKEIERLIKNAADMGFYQLDLTGGEILLHPDLEQIFKVAYKYGMIVTVFSNLTLLTDRVLQLFHKYSIKRVVTSIESIVANIHDEFRGKKGALDNTLTNMEKLKQTGLECVVNVVLGKHNVHTAVETVKYFYNLKYEIVIDFIAPLGRATQDLILSMSESRKIYDKIVEAISIERKTGLFCGVGQRMIFVSATGDIGLCPLLVIDDFVQGNIYRTYNLNNIAHNIFAKYGRLTCSKDCKMKEFCNGGCRARAFIENGDLTAPYNLYCCLHRVRI